MVLEMICQMTLLLESLSAQVASELSHLSLARGTVILAMHFHVNAKIVNISEASMHTLRIITYIGTFA